RVDGRDGPVRVRDYHPLVPGNQTPLLWVHGGGFTSGGLDQNESDAPARSLAAEGRLVRTVEYRLAPRANPFKDPDLTAHPGRYPAGLHDVVDVARSLVADTKGPISLGGGSAGANIAAAATLCLRDDGDPLPRAVVLAYGTFHAVLPPDETIEAELRGPLAKWAFHPKMLRRMNLNYVGDPALLVPGYAFPGGADLHSFPPTLVADAANDRLRRSGHAFAAELRTAGTQVREVVISSTHAYLNAPRRKSFAHGLEEISRWLTEHD
ncbi:MAG TPA: alpha/beta hydrolase fold domain-containing protein, partial [Vicinamibacterales bacterium]